MRRFLLALGLATGGLAGLVAEVAWIHLARLAVGVTSAGFALVVAIYLLGLAVGAWLGGRWSLRVRRPLRLAARVELVAAIAVVLSGPALRLAETLLGPWTLGWPGLTPALVWLPVLTLTLGPAALAAGVALPLVCRAWAEDRTQVPAGSAAWALFWQAIGAVVGAPLAALVLLPLLGTGSCLLLAALAGGGAAIAYAVAARREWPLVPVELATRPPIRQHWLLALAALVGVVGLGGEVLWARFMQLVVHHSLLAWLASLLATLIGLGLGAWAGTGLAYWRHRLLVVVLLAVTVAAILQLPWWLGPGPWRAWLGTASAPDLWRLVLPLVVPALLSGAILPVLIAELTADRRWVGADLGRLSLASSAGGVAALLCFGLLLLPAIGLQGSLAVASTAALLVAALGLWRLAGRSVPALVLVLVGGGALCLWPTPVGLPAYIGGGDAILAVDEGRQAMLAVVERGERRVLEIDRLWQGEDRPSHQRWAAHIPAILHGDPRRVAVVGLGVGQTADAYLRHPIEELLVIDSEPRLPELVAEFFPVVWSDDDRVQCLIADGLQWLRFGPKEPRWDIIAIEVGQTFRPGIADFYSLESYQGAAERLAPGGLCVQFVPLQSLDPIAVQRVVATFRQAFPATCLWYNTAELLLIGSKEASALRFEEATLAAQPAAVLEDLDEAYWGGSGLALRRPASFVSGCLATGAELDALAAGAAPLRLRRPWLAARSDPHRAVDPATFVEHLQEIGLAELRTVVAGEPDWLEESASIRSFHLKDLTAAASRRAARQARRVGDYHGARKHIDAALKANPYSIEAQLLLAELLAADQQFDQAETVYRRILEQDPRCTRAMTNYGSLLQTHGHDEAARSFFEEAYRLEPTQLEHLLNWANSQIAAGRPGAAVDILQAAPARHADQPMLRYSLGLAYLRRGQLPQAWTAFEGLRDLDDPYLRLQAVRQLAMTPGLAASDYARLTDLAAMAELPRAPITLQTGALIAAAVGDFERAQQLTEAALDQVAPQNPQHQELRLMRDHYVRRLAWQPLSTVNQAP